MHKLTPESLRKAIEKAQQVRNRVRMIQFRIYEVTTPEQHIYRVTFAKRGTEKYGSCNCAAKVPCYHLASAMAVHIGIARARQDEGNVVTFPTKPQREEIVSRREYRNGETVIIAELKPQPMFYGSIQIS